MEMNIYSIKTILNENIYKSNFHLTDKKKNYCFLTLNEEFLISYLVTRVRRKN